MMTIIIATAVVQPEIRTMEGGSTWTTTNSLAVIDRGVDHGLGVTASIGVGVTKLMNLTALDDAVAAA